MDNVSQASAARRPDSSQVMASLVMGLVGGALLTGFAAWFLKAESEYVVGFLLLLAVVGAVAASRLGALDRIGVAFGAYEKSLYAIVIAGVLVLAWIFRQDHFTLLMITTVMVYMLAGLGLNVQLSCGSS